MPPSYEDVPMPSLLRAPSDTVRHQPPHGPRLRDLSGRGKSGAATYGNMLSPKSGTLWGAGHQDLPAGPQEEIVVIDTESF